MDKYAVKYEVDNDSWKVFKNGEFWGLFADEQACKEIVNLLVLGTITGVPVEIDDKIEGTNLKIEYDSKLQIVDFC